MFEPFKDQIMEWISLGYTCQQMIDELPEGYYRDSLYTYIRVNKLRDNAWKKIYEARNHCYDCEYCHAFKNAMGTENKEDNHICTKSWRVISASVRHQPRWCEKGRKNDNCKAL